MELTTLIERFLQGDRRALARAITWVENGADEAAALIRATYPLTGRAHVIGITGPPGAGKSTLVDRLAGRYRQMGQSVAIVAVDPTSPFSGGAILGDRIRMQRTLADPGVFMRSLASRGHLGGISIATGDVVGLMDAFGFDVIIVETVGAGQSEVEIMELAHTTCVVLIPGMGDDIQAIKAGILEIGDVFAVNKADRDGADRTVMEIESMLDLGHMGEAGVNRWTGEVKANAGAYDRLDRTGHHGAAEVGGTPSYMTAAARHSADRHGTANPGDVSWRPPVVRTIAKDDQGTEDLVNRMVEHLAFLKETGRWEHLKLSDAAAKLRELISTRAARTVLGRAAGAGDLERLTRAVAERTTDPYTAADELLTRYLTL
ncbi:MAG TPA: methylmalonyl Co-A mutase-associated GTPase MeaB [Symbiobacteriaceae bacterium]